MFFYVFTKNLLKTVFNIDSDKIFIANQYNRMIFKGSCDTEDWSNEAKISALHHRNIDLNISKYITHFKIYENTKELYEIAVWFYHITFFFSFFIK